MNILLINHYAGSPRHGMEYRPFYLAREWVRAGHTVRIVAASYSHIRAEQPKFSGGVLEEVIDGVVYRWYATPAYRGNGVGRVGNILSFLWALWRDGHRLATEFKPDVVIASSTYPMDIWPAHRIAKLAGAKLIFEVHDLWPLSLIELGNMSKYHPFIIWVQWAEDYAYRHADAVVSLLPKAKEHMVSRGMDPQKFYHIPNGIDIEDWENALPLPEEISAELEKIKRRGLPIVCYAGTHGLANDLDTLLDAAKIGKGQYEVLMVGTGPEKDRLQRRVADERIDNVTMLPPIPKRAVPTLLREVDIGFIGWKKRGLYRFGISPNKLMDYMMAGKVIVHAVEAANDPVAEAGCGITVPPGDALAVHRAILQMAELPVEERRAMGLRGKQYVLSKHTYQVLAKQFLEVIAHVQT